MSGSSSIHTSSHSELKALHEIVLLTQKERLQDYFQGVMTVLSKSFPIKYSALFLQDPQAHSFHLEALYGIEKDGHPSTITSQNGIMNKVWLSRMPMVIQEIHQEPLYEEMLKAHKKTEKIPSPLICLPFLVDNETVGVMNITPLHGHENGFTEDFQFLSILSAILSPAIKAEQIKKGAGLLKDVKSKSKSQPLDEILEEKLNEVLQKIDPYVEKKARLGVYDDIIRVIEKILIKSALKRVNHVQTSAAQFLGINRNTLRKKIKELKIKTRPSAS